MSSKPTWSYDQITEATEKTLEWQYYFLLTESANCRTQETWDDLHSQIHNWAYGTRMLWRRLTEKQRTIADLERIDALLKRFEQRPDYEPDAHPNKGTA